MEQDITYTIRQIEKLTGIKAFTIRIWEKRYNFTNPQRTDTNIRMYTEADLHKLMAAASLVKFGYKISEIAFLSEEKMNEKLRLLTVSQGGGNEKTDNLLMAADRFDELTFEKNLNREILSSGFENTMVNVVAPLMQTIETKWIMSRLYKSIKNFVTDILRRKIIIATDSEPYKNNTSEKKILIFSTLNCESEMWPLFADYVFKRRGIPAVYIGDNIDMVSAEAAAKAAKCEKILCIGKINKNNEDFTLLAQNYSNAFSKSEKYFLGQNCNFNNKSIIVFKTLEEFVKHF